MQPTVITTSFSAAWARAGPSAVRMRTLFKRLQVTGPSATSVCRTFKVPQLLLDSRRLTSTLHISGIEM